MYYTQYKYTVQHIVKKGSPINRTLKGALTLAVLSQIQTPQYGYSLVQLLEKLGIPIDQSTLYPLLRRLEKQELVTNTWDTSESKPRKYYV